MKYKVIMSLEVDKDNPYIDATGDATQYLSEMLNDWIYDDDYTEIKFLRVDKVE